jgi:hypothetical protein
MRRGHNVDCLTPQYLSQRPSVEAVTGTLHGAIRLQLRLRVRAISSHTRLGSSLLEMQEVEISELLDSQLSSFQMFQVTSNALNLNSPLLPSASRFL